jgi:hypothetical protein
MKKELRRPRCLTACGPCGRSLRNPSALIGVSSMRPLLIIATVGSLLGCSPAFAQVGTVMPSIGTTSSLGTVPGAPVGPNGLQVGAAPTVTPVPNGITGTIAVPSTSSGAGACSTLATSPMGTFGSPATYDGGGLAMATGTATPAAAALPGISTSTAISATSGEATSSGMVETSGLTGMCGSGSSSLAASSNPTSTSPATTSGSVRAGIPMASYEIGNLGVSAATPVPAPSVPPMVTPSSPVPTIPTVSPATGSTIP